MVNMEEISHNLQSGKARETSALVTRAIAENYNIDLIIRQGLIAGIRAVQERYRRREILFPEISLAIRALNWGIKQIKLAITASAAAAAGTVIIGTVEGDMEDTEKNIIAVMLEGRGIRVIDLGAGVSGDQFIRAAVTEKADSIICSASRVSTMVHMKNLIQAAAAAGIRGQTKIILLGEPVSAQYCEIIGADQYAPDPAAAADMAAAYCD
jgi:methanogenic corrinoid protein MtbC1